MTSNKQLIELLRAALAEALPVHGFTTPPRSDNGWGRWFVPTGNDPVPHVDLGIGASLNDHHIGGLSITGFLTLMSTDATAVLAPLPAQALIKSETEERLSDGIIECPFFGEFVKPKYPALQKWITEVDQIESVVAWFIEFSTKPEVTDWLAQRNSLDNLIALARTPNQGTEDIVNPHRLRCVVALCLVNDQPADAASIATWYTQREHYNFFDSRDKAVAFDAALGERYPDYAAARHLGSD